MQTIKELFLLLFRIPTPALSGSGSRDLRGNTRTSQPTCVSAPCTCRMNYNTGKCELSSHSGEAKRLFLPCKSIAKKQDAPVSRPFGTTEKDAQKLHALWLLPMTAVRNTAHEVSCHGERAFAGTGNVILQIESGKREFWLQFI